jgi:hypothetical protein
VSDDGPVEVDLGIGLVQRSDGRIGFASRRTIALLQGIIPGHELSASRHCRGRSDRAANRMAGFERPSRLKPPKFAGGDANGGTVVKLDGPRVARSKDMDKRSVAVRSAANGLAAPGLERGCRSAGIQRRGGLFPDLHRVQAHAAEIECRSVAVVDAAGQVPAVLEDRASLIGGFGPCFLVKNGESIERRRCPIAKKLPLGRDARFRHRSIPSGTLCRDDRPAVSRSNIGRGVRRDHVLPCQSNRRRQLPTQAGQCLETMA